MSEELRETFEQWWNRIGFSLDPDTEDVDWYDKRKEFAMYAWNAARDGLATHPADGAEPIDEAWWMSELGRTRVVLRPLQNAEFGLVYDPLLGQVSLFMTEGAGVGVRSATRFWLLNHITTRSQLRDLLAALGVVS